MSFNPMLRRAMDNANMPTTPSLVAMKKPESLDELRDTVHRCKRRVKEIMERENAELKEAKADLKAAQKNIIDALQASDLGIDDLDDV